MTKKYIYVVNFNGRQARAIGIFYNIAGVQIEADNDREFAELFYDRWELSGRGSAMVRRIWSDGADETATAFDFTKAFNTFITASGEAVEWALLGTVKGYRFWVAYTQDGKDFYNVTETNECPQTSGGYMNLKAVADAKRVSINRIIRTGR